MSIAWNSRTSIEQSDGCRRGSQGLGERGPAKYGDCILHQRLDGLWGICCNTLQRWGPEHDTEDLNELSYHPGVLYRHTVQSSYHRYHHRANVDKCIFNIWTLSLSLSPYVGISS